MCPNLLLTKCKNSQCLLLSTNVTLNCISIMIMMIKNWWFFCSRCFRKFHYARMSWAWANWHSQACFWKLKQVSALIADFNLMQIWWWGHDSMRIMKQCSQKAKINTLASFLQFWDFSSLQLKLRSLVQQCLVGSKITWFVLHQCEKLVA